MSVRMRHTRGHTGNRRSHHALTATKAIRTEDGSLRLPHRVDEKTGMYRGKQIFIVKTKRGTESKVKGPSEKVEEHVHTHDHDHEHANAEVKASKGILGKLRGGGRPKARSGMGGGV